MKRNIAILFAIVMTLSLMGCGKTTYPDLPNDAAAFEIETFVDTNDDDALYGMIEYAGRTYIGYGTLGKSVYKNDIDQCVGYIIMDENSSSVTDLSDKRVRVYTLAGDSEHNYLMEYDTSTNLMNQPSFWRAVDTQGADIPTPAYINNLEYSFWD